jgi:hypothetical protein
MYVYSSLKKINFERTGLTRLYSRGEPIPCVRLPALSIKYFVLWLYNILLSSLSKLPHHDADAYNFEVAPTFLWGRGGWNLGTPSLKYHKKIKCTLVQALRLCTGRTAHRRSRGIALLFHDHGTRRGSGVSVKPRPLFTPGKRRGTLCTGVWVDPRAGQERCGKSRPHRDSIPGPSSP